MAQEKPVKPVQGNPSEEDDTARGAEFKYTSNRQCTCRTIQSVVEMNAAGYGGFQQQHQFDHEAATFHPAVVGGVDEQAFGWLAQHDPATNATYHVHSHTGEVGWSLAPEQPQHPQQPQQPQQQAIALPLYERYDNLQNPFYSPLVMLPAGITPTQPRLDSWRGGYERFPMHGSKFAVPKDGDSSNVTLKQRVLPCTWENSPHGPPFLPPFPVVLVQPVWAQEHAFPQAHEKVPGPPPATESVPVTASCWWPSTQPVSYLDPVASQPFYPASYVNQDFVDPGAGSVYPAQGSYENNAPPPLPALPPPEPKFKEHNRRGYNMRQAKKLMKQLALQATLPGKSAPSPATARPAMPHDQVLRQAITSHTTYQDQPSAIRVN